MKRLLFTVFAATAGLVAFGGARRRHVLRPVAKELRNPILIIPMSMRNERGLELGRKLTGAAVAPPVPEGVDVREEHVPGTTDRPHVRVLVYETPDRPRPSGALVWLHGGGLVMGTPEQDRELCGRIAAELGILVVNVDYRLAPEDPFPCGLEDCQATLEWVHEHAGHLGVDPARVAVGGASAGGGLAACLAQRAHDAGGPPVCFQLLEYPMLDDRSAVRAVDALVWSTASNGFAWSAYLGHPAGSDETRAHAVAARREDLAGLPPAWIGVGDIDLFHDEAVDYATRLRAAGVECELEIVPGMYHAADRVAPKAASMRSFVDGMIAALGRGLGAIPTS